MTMCPMSASSSNQLDCSGQAKFQMLDAASSDGLVPVFGDTRGQCTVWDSCQAMSSSGKIGQCVSVARGCRGEHSPLTFHAGGTAKENDDPSYPSGI